MTEILSPKTQTLTDQSESSTLDPTEGLEADVPSREDDLTSVDSTPSMVAEEVVIQPKRGWVAVDFAELWRYRELLFFLAWRDVKVRYKQTVLGLAWAILQPLTNMAIGMMVGGLAGLGTDGAPRPVFLFAALLPWTYFSTTVSQAGVSLISSQHLVTKIYFPRLFVPTASAGAALVDFAVSFCLLLAIMSGFALATDAYSFPWSWRLLLVIPLSMQTVVAAVGIGYLLSATTVQYRDFRYVIPFMMQTMLWVSPVMYSISTIPAKYHFIYGLNPMAGIVSGFRGALLGTDFHWVLISESIVITLLLAIIGIYYFRRVERRFADIA